MDRRTYFIILLLAVGWTLLACSIGFVMFLEGATVVMEEEAP